MATDLPRVDRERRIARPRRRAAPPADDLGQLGDFTATRRLLLLCAFAVGIGAASAVLALGLQRLIALSTNAFFFTRISTAAVEPSGTAHRWMLLVMPVVGGLLVGLIARYGSERIRGHGIPEALEAILGAESRIAPKLAFLKPVSAAVAIGSGGPFGSEGPIIMTGGAFGSVVAQYAHLSGAERKTLLVSGAAGGMCATFGTPLASILLAVELLLFEWRPRSFVPVTLAAVAAATVRAYTVGSGPLFSVVPHAANFGVVEVLDGVVVGIVAGAVAVLMTGAVYRAEDAFPHLRVHWMWWPAIGGIVVGLGGLFFPEALGVGYGNIRTLLAGDAGWRLILGVILVKTVIWSVALGSGTSGGVLAPLLMVGAAVGAAEAHVLPGGDPALWALVGMGAVLGGTMRSPLTGVVFPLELTHDLNALLPLLVAVVVAHTCTVLLLRRSILTEKLARRGRHVSREYALDPLELLLTREVLQREVVTLQGTDRVSAITSRLARGGATPALRQQRLYPVVDAEGQVAGVASVSDIDGWALNLEELGDTPLSTVMQTSPIVAFPDEPLRVVAERMATSGRTRLPVVARDNRGALLGIVSLSDLLQGRARDTRLEHRRERVRSMPKWRPDRAAAHATRRR